MAATGPDGGPCIGIDLGGTKVLGLALGPDPTTGPAEARRATRTGPAAVEVVASARQLTPRGGEAILDAVVETVERLTGDAGLAASTPVGVGVAGLVDRAGVLRQGPNLPGVVELDVAGALRARLGNRVVVDNDANCAARAEWWAGAARGYTDAVVLTLGTGIGAGLVVEGRILRGAGGLAGEPGHVVVDPSGPRCPCGGRGCWERYASGAGLARMAREAAEAGRLEAVLASCADDPSLIRGEDVVDAGRRGDPGALAVIAEFAWWTALGLANLTALLDPEVVVMGGGLADAADLWLAEVRWRLPELAVAAAHRRLPDVVAAHHGSAVVAVGAALLARSTTGTTS